jgi:hypothetical protein
MTIILKTHINSLLNIFLIVLYLKIENGQILILMHTNICMIKRTKHEMTDIRKIKQLLKEIEKKDVRSELSRKRNAKRKNAQQERKIKLKRKKKKKQQEKLKKKIKNKNKPRPNGRGLLFYIFPPFLNVFLEIG